MKLFRKVMSGLLAGSLILSLVACGAGPGATETGDPSGNGAVGTPSASGDEIVVNVSDNVTLINLEVYANNNSCEFLYADLVFDPLYYGDRQGNNSPCICTSYDLNEDGTEVTLHIKEGVKFHDGTDLNAEDVVATFEFMLRNMDTLGLASAVWSNLESVELIDEYTCKITLSQYFATFENSLTYTWILSDEDIEQYGDDFQSAERVINGSGPWKFVEWQDGQYARYTPNQNYWDPDAVSNIDTLNVWFVNQENAKVSGITSGNLDYTQSLRSDMVPLVENLEGVEVIEYTSDVMYYMQFDCAEDSIFSDPNARKAAAYALDVNTVLGLVGGGEKMNCMFLPSLLGYDESIEGYEYNPDLAREYLAKTDYNGEKLTLYTRNDLVAIDDVMAVFIQNLVDVGFNISTKICDSAEFVTIRQDPSAYDIFFVNLGAFDADPYMGGLFTGNLGHSTLYNSPVREVIAQRLPATICVSLISAVFVLLISVPIGIISGVTRGSMADFSLMFFVVILQSMSVVWVCVLLLLIFVVKLDILPSMGYYGLSRPAYLVMPVIAMGYRMCAQVARMGRSSMIDVLNEDYITCAYARGLSKREVYSKYALRNSMIPVITIYGLQVAAMLSGAVVVEQIFSIPGIGTMLVTAVNNRDYPLVQSTLLWRYPL